MQILGFTPDTGHQVSAFGSRGVTLTPVARADALHVVAMHLAPGGVIARHPAADVQLFLVVEGSGTVSGGDPEHVVAVEAGSAVVWERREEHETRAGRAGMRAIVVEGAVLGELSPDPRLTPGA
ncbi:MAG TPA: cupin domain-containing protein [Anaerolineae bacterium]|nr:cupin domain-containing protein [Anaerolineae bacterium]